ncbi:MAG TPA: hypothetical protein VMM56_03350 [Planctomycetaceae bacterium]|nr:hypothetical protein [Planctomycetaceae bacterium]
MSQSLRQPEPLETAIASEVCFAEAPDGEHVFPRVVFASADDEPVVEADEFDRTGPRVSRYRSLSSLMGSLLLHAGLLLCFGMFVTVVHTPGEEVVLADPILADMTDEELLEFDTVGATLEVQMPAAPSAFDREAHVPDTFTPDEWKQKFFSDQFVPAFAPEKKPEHKILITPAEGKKFRYRKPGDGLAVTAGSFTVWTEPSDPLPRQPYLIVFQIRVPAELETFPKSDLKIDVWGTDKFHLMIPDPRHNFALLGDLDVIDGEVQLVIPIPGAPALVKDLIQVESLKILRERQRLVITF